jgi:GxxExxY protein
MVNGPTEGDDRIGKCVVDAAFHVHKNLGPGLIESVYEACLCHELTKRDLKYERQAKLPIEYDGIILDDGLRLDVLVEGSVICELKAVETVSDLHVAQVLTYLRLSGLRLAYLINFNVKMFRRGIKRLAL